MISLVVRERAGQTSARFGAGEAAGAPQADVALPTSRAAREGRDVPPGVDMAASRVRHVLDGMPSPDLAAAISALRRAMESPGITTSEFRALRGALATVSGVARVRLERLDQAVDRRMLQTPRGDR